MRRAGQSVHKREVRRALNAGEWGPWEDMTAEFIINRHQSEKESYHVIFFKKNAIYSAQAFQQKSLILVGLRRHDQSKDIPWADKQRMKSELFGDHALAIEVFPPEMALVDQANMFWLWVLPPAQQMIDTADINLNRAKL